MKRLHEAKIKNVLLLLEKSVNNDIDSMKLEQLAQAHIENENKLNKLQEDINKLLKQQNDLNANNQKISEDIISMIGNTKSQSFRFGKILVEFKVTRESGVSKSAPQWKKIVESLTKTYEIEEKVITRLTTKFNNGGQAFTNVNKELNITTESVQLKENISSIIRTIWMGFKSALGILLGMFKNSNDELEVLLKQVSVGENRQ
jgi:hypothetical protein